MNVNLEFWNLLEYIWADRNLGHLVPTFDADMVPLRKAKLMVFDFYEICPTDSQDTKLS